MSHTLTTIQTRRTASRASPPVVDQLFTLVELSKLPTEVLHLHLQRHNLQLTGPGAAMARRLFDYFQTFDPDGTMRSCRPHQRGSGPLVASAASAATLPSMSCQRGIECKPIHKPGVAQSGALSSTLPSTSGCSTPRVASAAQRHSDHMAQILSRPEVTGMRPGRATSVRP